MKLYRTVIFKEFVALLLGEDILPKEQKSSVCIRNIDGKEVSACDEPFEAVCTFYDKLFWAVEDRHQYILIEMDVPEDRILFKGYGVYSTPFYNKHFNEDSYWMTNGTYGQARRCLKSYKIPEAYLSYYNYKDVSKVYFMNGCNLDHTLVPRDSYDGEEIFKDCKFNDYLYTLASCIRSSVIKKNRGLVSKEELSSIRKSLEWTNLIGDFSEMVSLNTFKKYLINYFPEMKGFISNFQYFNSTENLESLIAKGNVNYESFLDTSSMLSVLEDVYNPRYGISFVGLKTSKTYPVSVENTFISLVSDIKDYLSLGIDTLDLYGKEEEIKSFIYTLLLDTGLEKETV